jgi:hypothetical protein
MKKNFEVLEGGSTMKATRDVPDFAASGSGTHGRQKICRMVVVSGLKGLF